jgi:hypothetical protein
MTHEHRIKHGIAFLIFLNLSEDSQAVLASKNSQKINAEIKRFRTWLHKHQSEAVPDGSKQKLFGVVESFYRMGLKDAMVFVAYTNVATYVISFFLRSLLLII